MLQQLSMKSQWATTAECPHIKAAPFLEVPLQSDCSHMSSIAVFPRIGMSFHQVPLCQELSVFGIKQFVMLLQLLSALTTGIQKLPGSPVAVQLTPVTYGANATSVAVLSRVIFLDGQSSSAQLYTAVLTGSNPAAIFGPAFAAVLVNTPSVHTLFEALAGKHRHLSANSFIHPSIHGLMHSLGHSSISVFVCSLNCFFTCSFACLSNHSLIHSLTHSFIHLLS